jgi:ribosomal protein L21E
MGRLYIPVELSDTEEKEFRRKAFEKYEGKKGYLKNAAADAFRLWIKSQNKEKEK